MKLSYPSKSVGAGMQVSRREIFLGGVAAALVAKSGIAAALVQPEAAPGAAWDLTDLYPSDAAWAADREAILAEIARIPPLRGTLGQSAAALKTALDAVANVSRKASRLSVYASLKADEDLRQAANQERRQQAGDVFTRLGEATAWMDPELLALGQPTLERYLAAEPGLAPYRFALKDLLRQAPHPLDTRGETLLASAGSALGGPGQIRNQLASSDIPRPEVTLSTGQTIRLDDQQYTIHRDAPNREDRKLVFDKFWASYKGFESSLGAALGSKVRGDMFRAKARNYRNSLEWATSGDNIPEGVYRTLVDEANRGLPVLHRYFDLRRRMLNLPDLHYYDIYPALVRSDRRFPLADMRTLTLEAVQPLGPEYQRLIAQGTAARWMDPFPRPGKASGAYMSGGAYDVHPYLLLNLSDKYDGLSTYAHEWGHAMHTLLATKAQPFELAGYPTFTAEVASTAQELLLANMLVERAKTREDKLFYLGQIMENYRGTFFRQSMFAEFQLAINDLANKGEALSGEKMSALYFDLLKRYHGPKVAMEPAYSAEWMYIQHFYLGFYVWQYATSITAANYFAQKVMSGGAAERDRYLAVLRAGGSDYGYNLLKTGGLDMATPEPYRLLVDSFSKVLDQAEALV